MRRASLAPWIAACVVVLSFIPDSWAVEITPGEACSLLGDLSELPTEPGAQGPRDCAAILQCRFEARQAAGLAQEEGSTLTMEAACERVSTIQAMSEAEVRELANSLPDDSPKGCRQFLTCAADAVAGPEGAPEESSPGSVPDWKAEFDRICAQVPIAGSLTVEQLQRLIADTDALSETLKESDVPKAKLFLQRLEMCRSFFEYSIELLTSETHEEAQE